MSVPSKLYAHHDILALQFLRFLKEDYGKPDAPGWTRYSGYKDLTIPFCTLLSSIFNMAGECSFPNKSDRRPYLHFRNIHELLDELKPDDGIQEKEEFTSLIKRAHREIQAIEARKYGEKVRSSFGSFNFIIIDIKLDIMGGLFENLCDGVILAYGYELASDVTRLKLIPADLWHTFNYKRNGEVVHGKTPAGIFHRASDYTPSGEVAHTETVVFSQVKFAFYQPRSKRKPNPEPNLIKELKETMRERLKTGDFNRDSVIGEATELHGILKKKYPNRKLPGEKNISDKIRNFYYELKQLRSASVIEAKKSKHLEAL